MEQNRKDYIVIRRPANNLGKPICPIHLVISREHLSKYVDKYLDGKIKRNPNLSSDCERWGTMDCPNSYMRYSTKDKPYFKPKQDE